MEIGCGPGIATESFARRGMAMQCLEPSPVACGLARQACEAYGNVVVTAETFEAFSLENRRFDAVLAAKSFHWVSPELACRKSAEALRLGGTLILLWATPPQPNEEISEYLQPVYERYGLGDKILYHGRKEAYYRANFEGFAKMVGDSGWFE